MLLLVSVLAAVCSLSYAFSGLNALGPRWHQRCRADQLCSRSDEKSLLGINSEDGQKRQLRREDVMMGMDVGDVSARRAAPTGCEVNFRSSILLRESGQDRT